MTNVDDLLVQLREAIRAEVREEVRQELIAELGGKTGTTPGVRRTGIVPTLKSGGRRSPEAVEQIGKKVLAWVRSHPDNRVEQIAEGLATDTRTLALPILKLLAGKKLSKKGLKRGTTYRARG
jgi:hypothetical protein